MKIIEVKRLIGKGMFPPSKEWLDIRRSAIDAVASVVWPPESGGFTIKPILHGNGVSPIKSQAAERLRAAGWHTEHPWPIADRKRPGNMDGAYLSSLGIVAFEWETGNIASSHRSINKMCLGLLLGAIVGGILVVSSNELYPYLTDRVSNIGELERYFPLWSATPCDQGVLEIVVVEHDTFSDTAPLIPKGKIGRAAG